MSKNVLVVGGCGYIGSHCVRLLKQKGFNPVVLDNLIFGHREALPKDVVFFHGDLGDVELVSKILSSENIEVVMHFAAFAFVGESVEKPLKYYSNNVEKTIRLLQAMRDCCVRKFIFSSSCATFGTPDELPIHELTPQAPINPYGQSKLMVETILKDLAEAGQMSSAVFRYFNAAGASPDAEIGESHDPETHLIPLAIDAATGRRKSLKVFGTDYPTPDGTCLRDYVHVDDLSLAHILVIDKMVESSGFIDYNLGTGRPCSVKEVLDTVELVTRLKVPYENASRRQGDPPLLFADSSKARTELGWDPEYVDIKNIIETAWEWHKKYPSGYDDFVQHQ